MEVGDMSQSLDCVPLTNSTWYINSQNYYLGKWENNITMESLNSMKGNLENNDPDKAVSCLNDLIKGIYGVKPCKRFENSPKLKNLFDKECIEFKLRVRNALRDYKTHRSHECRKLYCDFNNYSKFLTYKKVQ